MYYLLNAPFILDFITTIGLFILCFLIVIGSKSAITAIKELLPKPKPKITKDVNTAKRQVAHRKSRPVAKPVRSIEIDPEQVDRIYVKKIS